MASESEVLPPGLSIPEFYRPTDTRAPRSSAASLTINPDLQKTDTTEPPHWHIPHYLNEGSVCWAFPGSVVSWRALWYYLINPF